MKTLRLDRWTLLTFVATTLAVGVGCAVEARPARHAGGGQPNMEAARRELAAAHQYLERAEHNKGGHRERAIGLIDEAIAEIDRGIEASD